MPRENVLKQHLRRAARITRLLGQVVWPLTGMREDANSKGPDAARLQKVAKSLLDIAGVKVHVNGALLESDKDTAVVYCANHSSYLDVPVMLSLAQGVLVGKNDIPAGSKFAKAINFLQVKRESDKDRWAPEDQDALPRAINAGHDILVFPEATCSDGTRILPVNHATVSIPFNQSGVKPERNVVIQPMIFTPRTIEGERVTTQALRDKFALYGPDSKEGPHFMNVLKMKGMEIDVDVLSPIDLRDWTSANAVQGMVATSLAVGLARRVPRAG